MLEFQIYRDCFSTTKMREIWSEEATVASWLHVEQTLAFCQAEMGMIPTEASEAIGHITLADLDLTALAEDMILVGRPIVGLVKQLRMFSGEHGAHVHYKSTTQDIMDTAMALQMKAGIDDIREQTECVIQRIRSHIKDHTKTKIIARTNGQHAVPMKLNIKLEVWISELNRRIEALDQAAERGLNAQVGGPAGDLRDYDDELANTVKQGIADQLGLRCVQPHWQNARDGVADIITALGILCGSLCKISKNINALSSSDIAEASEVHTEKRGASSSMKHKKNQRASEFGEAVARLGRQRSSQITEHMMHEHERSGGVWIGEWVLVPEVFILTSGALRWCDQMFTDLVFDSEVMKANIDDYERRLINTSKEGVKIND